jgi:hypothetical protein
MVQYLYAAYLLGGPQVPQDKQQLVNGWRRTLLDIAREEMGHLASVQNLLRFVGGPLNLEREDFPFRTGFYPFRFKLERLTKNSLAKYVYAEMPEGLAVCLSVGSSRVIWKHDSPQATNKGSRRPARRKLIGELSLVGKVKVAALFSTKKGSQK